MRYLFSICIVFAVCSCATPSQERAQQDLSESTTAQLRVLHEQVVADYAASVAGNRQGTGNTSLSSIDSFAVGAQDGTNAQRLNQLRSQRRDIENELIRRHEAGDAEARFW